MGFFTSAMNAIGNAVSSIPASVWGPAVGAGVSGGLGLIGGALQRGAVQNAQQQAQGYLQGATGQARADLMPWISTGGQALGTSADLLGLRGPDAANAAMANFQTTPGYQWQLEQGLRAVDQGAAARGMLRSGATLKAEQAYGSGLADQEFGNYYNRLSDLATSGERAAAGVGGIAAQLATPAASAALGGGTAQSSIYGNQATGLGANINQLLSNPAFQQWLTSGGTPNYAGAPSGFNASAYTPNLTSSYTPANYASWTPSTYNF